MLHRILYPLFFLSLSLTGFSQLINRGNNKYEIRMQDATWHFQIYNDHILKVSINPDSYQKNENISDAVILQPSSDHPEYLKIDADHFKVRYKNISFFKLGDTIYFGDQAQCKLIGSFKDSTHRGFRFRLSPAEMIFGAGERAISLNRRGYQLPLYNEPHGWYGVGQVIMNYSVPFITSSNHYALFFDNPAKGYLDIGKKDSNVMEYGTTAGELNFFVITGNDYPEILENYHQLTGTQPLPPRWSMGNFMSRFGYRNEKQVTDIFNKMKQDSIPFDAVIFDLFWFGDSIKNGLGNLDWVNPKAWPNPQKMIAGFNQQGVKTVLITEPFILENTLSFDKLKPFLAVDSKGKYFRLTDFYFGYGGLLDIFRKQTRKQFWTYYKKQMNIGVEGWWGDLGEPEKHPSAMYHNLSDFGIQRLMGADEVHNIYGHYWTKMLYDNYKKAYPEKRLFSLNRSGFAGSQRYSIFPWSGDVARTWSGFQAQLPIMLGMSMSGIPYIHSDAGGFTGGDKDQELYVRWMQFSAFSPVLKPHGFILDELDPNSPSFPSEATLMDQPFKSYAKTAIDLRYHRLPYHYTLCYLQSRYAQPLVSPLYYYFSKDSTAVKTEDEYMYGPSILVAPVTDKGRTSRNLYLPIGSNWYRWNDNHMISAGTSLNEYAPLEKIPVFVKAGSFIPLIPDSIALLTTATYSTGNLDWHYYYDTISSEFTMYDDDGSSRQAMQQKNYELIRAAAQSGNKELRITIQSNGGKYPGKPSNRKINLILHGIPEKYNQLLVDNNIKPISISKTSPIQLTIELNQDEQVIRLIERNE